MKTMHLNKIIFSLLFTFMFLKLLGQENYIQKRIIPKDNISYIDGPYIFHKNGQTRIININERDEIIETHANNIDSFLVKVPNQVPDQFYVRINQNIQNQPSIYKNHEKIFVISDIEGNYYSFVNLLIGNKIVDKNLNWIYGSGHLVLNGDFVDRGEYVTQVLWLIYKLEQEASVKGGHVHFILGNHEIMNLKGNFKYVRDKYRRLAFNLNIPFSDFYNNENEIGRWMRSKNVIERIGDVLFVHAGLSHVFLKEKMTLNTINELAQSNYGLDFTHDTLIMPNLLFGRYGPLWYRGLVSKYKYYPKANINEINDFLKFYDSNSIVVGHTIVDDISSDYGGKVVRIDIHHPANKNSKYKSKALLIENGKLYKVNINGKKTEVEEITVKN